MGRRNKKNKKTSKTCEVVMNASNPVSKCNVLSYADMANELTFAAAVYPASFSDTPIIQNDVISQGNFENLTPLSTPYSSESSPPLTPCFTPPASPSRYCYLCKCPVFIDTFYLHTKSEVHNEAKHEKKLLAAEKTEQDECTLVIKSK